MDERRKAAWEELNITRDELKSIGDALKNEEFRKLLGDYVDEINDPENKRIYEEEIKQLEKERGVDCTFVHPVPGYVIKTSVDGERKAFINICRNENIGKPTSEPGSNSDGTRGLNWSLPYIQAPPRDDLDKKSKRCSVFDVVFHPDTLRLASNNAQFRNMVNNTALDAVENSFNVKLDRKNLKFPKTSFKGTPQATVIRQKSKSPCASASEANSDHAFPFPYPYKHMNSDEAVKHTETVATTENKKQEGDDGYTLPRYTIKYRDSVDIQDFANDRDAKINAAIPKELIITIFLPLLSSTANVELDVNEKWIHLKSTQIAKYFLRLPLPYAIIEELGTAKFDKSERKLVLTLPVKRTKKTVADLTREDSGVESDAGVRTPESEEEVVDDSVPNLITVVSSSDGVDNCERTRPKVTIPVPVVQENFLNPDIHYCLPPFTCNVVDNTLAFTLHVKNVEPDSLKHKLLDLNNGVHICFSSVGSGFFPIYYAFFVQLPMSFTIASNGISIETWDNNVITQLVLNSCDNVLTKYSVGVDEESALSQELSEPAAIGEVLNLVECTDEIVEVNVQVSLTEKSKDQLIIEITPKEKRVNEKKHSSIEEENGNNKDNASKEEKEYDNSGDDVKEQEACAISEELNGNVATSRIGTVTKKLQQLDIEKTRCYSESSSDEMHLSPTKRGILKCRSVNRSLSESNAEDYCFSSSLDAFQHSVSTDSCIPEEPEEGLGSKKTVRFNEVISRKTFRINSSILGQQKKNQRKLRNRKRAQERRASESETSEGESEKLKENGKRTSKDLESKEKANNLGQNTSSRSKDKENSEEVYGNDDKASYSSGSGDETGDMPNKPQKNEQPNPEGEIVQNKDAPATIKHVNRRKRNHKRIRNPKNYGMQQLDFKNDLIFDLDM